MGNEPDVVHARHVMRELFAFFSGSHYATRTACPPVAAPGDGMCDHHVCKPHWRSGAFLCTNISNDIRPRAKFGHGLLCKCMATALPVEAAPKVAQGVVTRVDLAMAASMSVVCRTCHLGTTSASGVLYKVSAVGTRRNEVEAKPSS